MIVAAQARHGTPASCLNTASFSAGISSDIAVNHLQFFRWQWSLGCWKVWRIVQMKTQRNAFMSVVWKQNWEWNGCKIVPVYKVCINPPTNIDNLSQSCLNVAVKREMCWQRNVFRNVLKARARVWMPRVRCHVRPLPSRGFDDNFMSVGKIIKWKSTSWWIHCLIFQSLIGSFMTDCCEWKWSLW